MGLFDTETQRKPDGKVRLPHSRKGVVEHDVYLLPDQKDVSAEERLYANADKSVVVRGIDLDTPAMAKVRARKNVRTVVEREAED